MLNVIFSSFTLSSIPTYIRLAGGLLVSIALMLFLWGVFMYVMAHGNEHEKEEGRIYMCAGLVALFYFVVTWAVVRVGIGFFT